MMIVTVLQFLAPYNRSVWYLYEIMTPLYFIDYELIMNSKYITVLKIIICNVINVNLLFVLQSDKG